MPLATSTVWASVAVFVLGSTCASFLVIMSTYQIILMWQYRRHRGPDPAPAHRYPREQLPTVTVQLPTYNEGMLAEQCLRLASQLDYPAEKLQIQFLDDSTDGVSSHIAQGTIARLKGARPELNFQYIRRENRINFKAGALRVGTAQASGDLLAVFDADFLIPRDFLRRTVDYFCDPEVAAVQGRWAYVNRDKTLFTRLQAKKLDAHQMFEQTARARWGLAPMFHGTAGIWRATCLEEAGGWDCISEVEDLELSIRSVAKGRRIVYLDHLRVPCELPETMIGFLRQQMRWKRGWVRVARHYTGLIALSKLPARVRLDMLQRVHLTWGPASALVMTMGALPLFIAAAQLGLLRAAQALYLASLVLSLVARFLEARIFRDDPVHSALDPMHPLLRLLPLGYIFGMGSLWTLTQATMEGFKRQQFWEVTPKSGSTPGSPGHQLTKNGRVPGHVIGTFATGASSLGLMAFSVANQHPLAVIFYLSLSVGCGWVGFSSLSDLRKDSVLLHDGSTVAIGTPSALD